MNEKVQQREYAINLRMGGMTYDDILREVPVARGTLSNWLRGLALPDEVRFELKKRRGERVRRARQRDLTVRKASRIVIAGFADREAKKEFLRHAAEPRFLVGLALYAGRAGGRTGQFAFMCSSPELMGVVVRWAEEFVGTSLRLRLYLSGGEKGDVSMHRWGEATGLSQKSFARPVYSAKKQGKSTPYGTARLEIKGARAGRRVGVWTQELIARFAK